MISYPPYPAARNCHLRQHARRGRFQNKAAVRRRAPKNHDPWERWQKHVIHLLVLALKIISALAIIALFAIAEYAAVRNVARALADEPIRPQCTITSAEYSGMPHSVQAKTE
jgi:hypothetical protein